MAGGGQRLLRLLTNVLEACKRTSIPVKSGRIQTEAQVAREDITQKSTKTIPLRLERAVTQYGDFQFA